MPTKSVLLSLLAPCRAVVVLSTLSLLAACGGGGGGGSSNPPAATAASGNSVGTSGGGSTTTGGGTSTGAGGSGTGSAGGGSAPPTSSAPTVSALAMPAVTQDPQSLVVASGQPASFTVQASGSDSLAYQWMRGGNPISGATAKTYLLPATQLADNGATFSVAVTNSMGSATSATAHLTVNAVTSTGATASRLFSDRSMWNARPAQFTLGTEVIPTSSYFPYIGTGPYSVTASIGASTDPTVTVYPLANTAGVWVPDAEQNVASVVIPHWPASVVAAAGSDGHADIIDVANNRIHSFWQLKQVNGQWQAAQYTWTAIDGTGWGTPAEYMQGSRAAGVVPIAGLVRAAEVHDGQLLYQHALAVSLTYNALARSPSFVFPATMADSDAASANSGVIPEGSLLMLPSNFDTTQITNAELLKVVQTLKVFGARVVDRNVGTPFYIYVENSADFNLMPNGWDNTIATQLDQIRAALRRVAQVTQWVDATGSTFTPSNNLNLISMRGPWTLLSGPTAGTFDTWMQSVTFASNGQQTVQRNDSGRSLPWMSQNPPTAGQQYQLTVHATGGAMLQFQLNGMTQYVNTGYLADGATATFSWPSSWAIPMVIVKSGAQGGGTVSATMTAL